MPPRLVSMTFNGYTICADANVATTTTRPTTTAPRWRHIFDLINFQLGAVVVVQLLEWLLPIQRSKQVRNQSSAKNYWTFTVNCIEKTKRKEKEAGNCPFLKKKLPNGNMASLTSFIAVQNSFCRTSKPTTTSSPPKPTTTARTRWPKILLWSF